MSYEHATTYHRLETVRKYAEIHMQAWHYIEVNGDKRVGLDDFVKDSGFSVRQVQRALSWHDTTWQRLAREIKMNYARVMLRHTQKPIHTIASQIGYSHSQLSRTFKAEEGMTPEEYRQWIQTKTT